MPRLPGWAKPVFPPLTPFAPMCSGGIFTPPGWTRPSGLRTRPKPRCFSRRYGTRCWRKAMGKGRSAAFPACLIPRTPSFRAYSSFMNSFAPSRIWRPGSPRPIRPTKWMRRGLPPPPIWPCSCKAAGAGLPPGSRPWRTGGMRSPKPIPMRPRCWTRSYFRCGPCCCPIPTKAWGPS